MESLAALAMLNPRPKLVFAGEGDLKPALEAEILRLGLHDDVEFSGHVHNMPSLLNQATLVLAPSLVVESFGRVPIEAGACGKVCLVSNLGGFKATVRDGETGFFCEAGNINSLANTIEKALNSNLGAMGAKARAHINQNFSLNVMCEATLAVYNEILLDKSQN
jgi:glycosyltransferase involved in cell wall biosynthesis